MAFRLINANEIDQVITELMPADTVNVPNPVSVLRHMQRNRLLCRSYQCDTLEHTNVAMAQTLALCSVLSNFMAQRRMYDPHSEMGYICEQNCETATQALLDFLQLNIVPRTHARSIQVLAVANNEENVRHLADLEPAFQTYMERRIRPREESESSDSEEEEMEPLRQRRRVEEPVPEPPRVVEPPRIVVDLTGYESSDSDATQLMH